MQGQMKSHKPVDYGLTSIDDIDNDAESDQTSAMISATFK
jgi:hypothetical protein